MVTKVFPIHDKITLKLKQNKTTQHNEKGHGDETEKLLAKQRIKKKTKLNLGKGVTDCGQMPLYFMLIIGNW